MSSGLYLLRRKWKEDQQNRRSFNRFSALITTPDDLGSVSADSSSTSLSMPSNGRLAISFDAAVDAGDASISAGVRDLGIPTLEADVVHKLDWIERGRVVTVDRGSAAPECSGTLYVIDPLGRPFAIATFDFGAGASAPHPMQPSGMQPDGMQPEGMQP